MQCTNCQFQNMPGSDVCGRCGTSLGIATAVMDVQPPRAGRWTKRLRRVAPVQRAYYGARDAMAEASGSIAVRRMAASLPPFGLFARLIVPGWSHFYAGEAVRGHLFLWTFLAALLPGLLLFGSGLGSVLLGLAFTIHSTAALDVVMATFTDAGRRDRMLRSIVVSIVLGAAVYWPALWLLTRVADPHVMQLPMPGLQTGDVVLVNHWSTPRPGDLVLYTLPALRLELPTRRGRLFYQFAGEHMNRVVAVAGDRVRWENGELFVNGIHSHVKPLHPERLPKKLEFKVGAEHVLILPSTTPNLAQLSPYDDVNWSVLSNVPLSEVQGRVYVRTQPLRRFELLH